MIVNLFVVGSIVSGSAFAYNCPDISDSGFFLWQQGSGPEIYCPTWCCSTKYPDRCCACEGSPCWLLNNSTLCDDVSKAVLFLEPINNFGETVLLSRNSSDVYHVQNTGAFLPDFPTNVCDFASSLVFMDFSYNRISDLTGIDCLFAIDTILLNFNLIKTVTNTTFRNMRNLRVLSLRGNIIENLPPNAFRLTDHNIFTVDTSQNFLDTVDITNIIRPGPFCLANMSNSFIIEITNEIQYEVKHVTQGPGDIDLNNSGIKKYPNFTEVGINSDTISSIVSGDFIFDSGSLLCDCSLYPFVYAEGLSQVWRNFDKNFTCIAPEQMAGVNLFDVVEKKEFEKLTCDLQNCPFYGVCHCTDIPSANKVVVNCTGAGLTEFPDDMPVGYWNNRNLDLILVDNHITEIPNRDYINRLVNLDLRGNLISSAQGPAVEKLTCSVNMANQQLYTLTSEFRLKDPNLITFGETPVSCDCTNLWIGDWIRFKEAFGKLLCAIPGGRTVPAESVTDASLDCEEELIPVAKVVAPSATAVAFLLILIIFCFIFKYELLIAVRKFRKKQQEISDREIDVFVSFCESNDSVFDIFFKYIESGLRKAGYSTYIPCRDVAPGCDLEDVLASAIKNSRNYVILLTKDYIIQDAQTAYEFGAIWKNFIQDKSTQIIIINLEHSEPRDVSDRRLKAFLRIKADLSFRERDDQLINRLKVKLGSPRRPHANSNVQMLQTTSLCRFRNIYNYNEKEVLRENAHEQNSFSQQSTANQNEANEINQTRTDKSNHERPKGVFDRLNTSVSRCNSGFRRCYLHAGALDS